ncbi:MAG TPA: TetR/AcrR family transcriptional regulator [Steroidobacteraceae bacterium]|jgi:AcrR family transcriptional regulator|nr:TetR/AcrR family transcriptional regulator [Steroidobacteraceae bacterium]
MPKLPSTRDRILAAARQIVEREGAGALTYEGLVQASGITRGGITYHFPTKEALLRGLLDDDFRQWDDAEAALTPTDCDPETAKLLGFIRTLTAQDESHRRFLCGMLSAATLDPSLMDPCRQELRDRLGRKQWTDRDLRLHLVHLAAEGLMWQELFQMYSMPGPARARLVSLMEELAREWGGGPSRTGLAKEA